jgi:hypothetical protein
MLRDRLPRACGFGLALLLGSACASSGAPSPQGPGATQSEAPTLTGYDAEGRGLECAPPREDCKDAEVNADFRDRCRLAGYRLLRCGCDDACSGNVKKEEKFFDATGKEHSCSPEQAGCTPPETSAQFQDACTDARHKLVVCGCEWLCNGPFTPGKASASE